MTVSNCPREEGELEKDQVVVLHRGLEYPTLSKAKKNIPIPISDYRVQLYTPSQSASGSVFLIMTFFPDYYEMWYYFRVSIQPDLDKQRVWLS